MSERGRRAAPAATRDAALLEAFLEMLAAERGASANTLAAYRRDLEDFREQAGRLAAASAADVRRYLAALAGRGLAASSQARRLSALRQFFRFLVAEGLSRRRSDRRPPSGRSRGAHLPKVLSVGDVDRLLDSRARSRPPRRS